MAKEIYGLSHRDCEELRTLLAEYRNRRGNPSNRPWVPDEQGQTPEVFIARTPPTGIPALTADPLTGTGVGTSSGDRPGHTDLTDQTQWCELYRIIKPDGVTPELLHLNMRRLVYNLSTTAIPGNAWIQINRDKSGSWLAVTGGGAGADDVYVVRTPFGGIPGLTPSDIGTGSGVGDSPGYADCYVYEISGLLVPGLPTTPILFWTGLQQRVFNLHPYPVLQDTWMVIAKDKYGAYLAVEGVEETAFIQLNEAAPGTDGFYDASIILYSGGGWIALQPVLGWDINA